MAHTSGYNMHAYIFLSYLGQGPAPLGYKKEKWGQIGQFLQTPRGDTVFLDVESTPEPVCKRANTQNIFGLQ